MANIVISGDTSGAVTLQAPAIAGTTTLTLPTTSGTVVTTAGAATVQFAAGSAASPSITFTGNTTTGLFNPAASVVGFATAGVEAMRITSGGAVVIGATSASGIFQVTQASGSMYLNSAGGIPRMTLGGGNGFGFNRIVTSEDIFFGEPGDTGTWRVRGAGTISLGVGSTGTTMTMGGNGGLVGIGTTNPGAQLAVHSTTEWGVTLRYAANTTTNRATFLTQRALGTLAAPLTVTSGTIIGGLEAGAYNGTAYTSGFNGGAAIQIQAEGTWTASSNPTNIQFFTNPSGGVGYAERFRIGPAGQLGIGGANYGTSGQALVSGGPSAAPVWTTLAIPYFVDFLIVAGGGGGGWDWAGGGGAGGYISSSTIVGSGTAYTVTVGGGGAAPSVNTSPGGTGGNSSFSAHGTTAVGGGGGGSDQGGDTGVGGGSGGGGAIDGGGGAGTSGQGNNGASGNRGDSLGGGGGGGAGAAGSVSAGSGGNGGVGLNWQSLGTFYAGGGGGGRNGTAGSGGNGGGGNGGNGTNAGRTAGAANTGGGGGGGGAGPGAAGGSGIVIIRYLGAQRGSGGTVTSAGGFTYHTFTTSGTYTG